MEISGVLAIFSRPMNPLVETLTPRQREVLDRMLAGQTVEEIARDLDVSEFTVETHRFTVLARLGAF